MKRVQALAEKVSNWGRWGKDDERGTINLVGPEEVKRAGACVKKGKIFSLGLPLGHDGPQDGSVNGRFNPIHLMTLVNNRFAGDFHANDDVIIMPLQCATQWDSLAHVFYGGRIYNGYVAADTVSAQGAAKNSIAALSPGVVARGVVLDMARHKGVERLAPGQLITPEDLEAAEKRQGVRLGLGDVLLLRTGHLGVFKKDQDRVAYMGAEPGIGLACIEWLHERQIAAIAADTMAVEVMPNEKADLPFPVHLLAIRDMGMPLGEMFDLDALAADCAEDGVWECFFSAPPLKITGGVGSPLNPLAVK